ncbi:MAG: Rossmann-like and DUF2520 domain-containing protein [Mangrovibacterium sp.]
MIQRVILIGAGNLATHIGKAFSKAGIQIIQVYSRTLDSAGTLGKILGTAFTNLTEEIDLGADLILVSVKDDAIGQVLDQVDLRQQLIVHTAGSVPLDFLKKYSARCGVFYPLQTFSKGRKIDFSDIPVCIEANSAKILNELRELAGKISNAVYEISSEERKILHLAAVFACNFVNHFYYISDQLLEKEGLAFDLLKPLIRETAAKVMTMDPYEAQTGPAKRFDETIINKHLKLMDNRPDLREIYSFVSRSIFQAHKK